MNESLKVSKYQAKVERDRELYELAKQVLANPLMVGLTALALNRIAYASGAYKPLAGERETSILGGPVWWHLGTSLPAEQERYEKTNLLIVTATVAMAASGSLRAIGQTIPALVDGSG